VYVIIGWHVLAEAKQLWRGEREPVAIANNEGDRKQFAIALRTIDFDL
jgi:hypothetical protein